MTKRTSSTTGALVLAVLLIGAGCGGSDSDVSDDAVIADSVEDVAPDDQPTADDADADADAGTAPGFGELIEGTFRLSGAADESFVVGDDQYAFQTTGGCQEGNYGFGVQVNDAEGTATLAMFGVQGEVDFSGGLTGEFDDVEFEATLITAGDSPTIEGYSGPVKMIVSEHDTGGVDFDLNARRMTIALLGTVPSDAGDVDVDISYRWVMGCP